MTHNAMTIVICLDHASLKGGQERVAFDSAIGLKRQGHRPIVFTAFGPIAPLLTEAGIETICLDQNLVSNRQSHAARAVQNLWNRQAAAALERLFESVPRARTIIHVHGWAGALSPAIAGPIARSGLPAIFTIHDYSMFCPNGGFYNYQRQHICALAPLSTACWASHCDGRSYARKLIRNTRLFTARRIAGLPRIFDDYIAISDLQQQIVAPFLSGRVLLHRVSNPVSVPDLGPRIDAPSGEVVFVGRLTPEKGVMLFAEAARRVGMIPTFIGDGPLAGELATRFPEARLTGWRDQTAVHQALRAASALVFPSVWYEGLPLSVLEAQGLGVPVIVSDACAGRESVLDGVTGLWFRSSDVDDLALALARTRDGGTMRAMSDAAYGHFWANPPTLDAHLGQLTSLYRDVLERRHAKTIPANLQLGKARA